jgi:signal transduction histidine kinase
MLMHDIRNPLNVVSITAELVKARSGDEAGRIDTILANTAKIDTMVTELLDAVRLEADQGLDLKFVLCDVRTSIQASTEGAQLAYPGRIEISLPAEPAVGMIDASGLARAVENLISNTIKYGDSKEQVRVELRCTPDWFIIAVHNWGQPIEKDQATIFVTFARSEDPEKNYLEKGWGLGLAYVKAVAEGHGGEVRVESSKKNGTTFSILIPREPEKAAKACR